MSKHSEAYEAYKKLLEYTNRPCKECIFAIKDVSCRSFRLDNRFCALDGCPYATTSSVLSDCVFERIAELEQGEKNE